MRIYVGNLHYQTSEESVVQLFSRYGVVEEVLIFTTRSGDARAFGFVTMRDGPDAEAAIRALDGFELEGRAIVVNKARRRYH